MEEIAYVTHVLDFQTSKETVPYTKGQKEHVHHRLKTLTLPSWPQCGLDPNPIRNTLPSDICDSNTADFGKICLSTLIYCMYLGHRICLCRTEGTDSSYRLLICLNKSIIKWSRFLFIGKKIGNMVLKHYAEWRVFKHYFIAMQFSWPLLLQIYKSILSLL